MALTTDPLPCWWAVLIWQDLLLGPADSEVQWDAHNVDGFHGFGFGAKSLLGLGGLSPKPLARTPKLRLQPGTPNYHRLEPFGSEEIMLSVSGLWGLGCIGLRVRTSCNIVRRERVIVSAATSSSHLDGKYYCPYCCAGTRRCHRSASFLFINNRVSHAAFKAICPEP